MKTHPTHGDLMNLDAELAGLVRTLGAARVLTSLADVLDNNADDLESGEPNAKVQLLRRATRGLDEFALQCAREHL